MRKKLFIASVIVILGTPIFLLGRLAYENNRVVARAKELVNQIPKYPGATFSYNSGSFWSLGHGEAYRTDSNPDSVIDFYKSRVGSPWVFKENSGASNSKAILYRYQDFLLDISVSTNEPSFSKAKPPYILDIDISQVSL